MSKKHKRHKGDKGGKAPSMGATDWPPVGTGWPSPTHNFTNQPKWLGSSKSYKPCHETHPVLKLGKGEVLGASCNHPRSGFDIYVGLDHGMARQPSYPWEVESKVVEVYFPVVDGSIPKDVGQYLNMVDWLVAQLDQGKRIHMGCIGGHGRTGTLLAALISRVHGDSNAGEWVRKNYCKSAIETTTQIKFLQEHFGISPVAPSKEGWGSYGTSKGGSGSAVSSFAPLRGRSIWNEEFVVDTISGH